MMARKRFMQFLCGVGALVGLGLALIPQQASTADTAACCLRGSGAAYSIFSAQGQEPDEKFFTVKSPPPNVMLLLDNSESMFELQAPSDIAAPWEMDMGHPNYGNRYNAGCNNPTYDALLAAGGFSMANSYEPIDQGVDPTIWPEDTGFPKVFEQDKFYFDYLPFECCGHGGWGSDFVDARLATNPGPPEPSLSDADTLPPANKPGACDRTSNPAECLTCVATKGYYLDRGRYHWWGDPIDAAGNPDPGPRADVFSGKFLNFYPPKFLVARTTLKKMIWNMRNVRLSLATYNGNNGAWLRMRFAPACSKLTNQNDPAWEDQRKNMIRLLNANPWWNPAKPPLWPSDGWTGISFYSNTPLAEALLDIGNYFSSDDSLYDGWFGTGWTDPEFRNDYTKDNRSVCYGCQLNAVMVLTDGSPERDNCVPQCIRNANPPCPYPGCSTSIYGNFCGNSFDGNYNNIYGAAKPQACPAKCGAGATCTAAGTSACCQNNGGFFLPGVAKWLYTNDMQTKNPADSSWSADGMQRLNTYVVAIGIDHPVLRHTAEQAGGQYFTSSDRSTLEAALNLVVSDVVRKATSFGVSSVSTLQTGSGVSTLVPRFTPAPAGEQWKGLLYRFALSSELTNGCTPTTPPATPSANDINKDGDCYDVFFTDRDGSIVEEDANTGLFVKKGTTNPARPVWEAGRELTYDSPTYNEPETATLRNPDTRNIWTVVDSTNDGKLDASDEMIEFSVANAARLMPYMNIGTDVTGDAVCAGLYSRLGVDPITSPLSTWGLECAKAIIEYYRGKRALDADPAVRNQARPWLLADVFHSSPVTVEPPISEGACGYFRDQCVSSLFTYKGRLDPQSRDAWRKFVQDPGYCGGTQPCETRPSFVLVGSNGGFLHALDNGRPAPKGGQDREPLTQRLFYDDGSGRELWAFIPSDLLGSLKYKLEKHSYFVDGTPMVRDIWVDSSTNPYAKDASEFRTVAVVGERSGGPHFFALDVTQNVDVEAKPKPKFLWTWPQPCDSLAAQVGESWSNYSPKPPPIFPVLFEDPSGFEYPFRRFNAGTGKWDAITSRVRERWVVLLNGGYDRSLVRGRGFSMVDVYTGQTYWSEFFDSAATAKAMNKRLEYPFAAGPGVLDIGAGEPANREYFDGYFDTATLGDLGGNMWVARFYEPGQLDPVTNRVTNWSFARAFQQAKDLGDDMRTRRPISYISANALQPDNSFLRTFFGSGDRASLQERDAGTCTLDSLYTCAAMGCQVQSTFTLTTGTGGDIQIKSKWQGGQLKAKTIETLPCVDAACYQTQENICVANCGSSTCTGASAAHAGLEACLSAARTVCPGACGAVCAETRAEMRVKVDQCPPATTSGPNRLERWAKLACKTSGTGNLECTPTVVKNDNDKLYTYSSFGGVPLHRFYGVHAFGGNPDRIFNTPAEAETFDSKRLSDSNTCTGMGTGPADCLMNLGSITTATGNTASPSGAGWFLSYDNLDERTASSAGLTFSQSLESGCVVWNTLRPKSSAFLCGGGANVQQNRLVQADYITGGANCIASSNANQRLLFSADGPVPLPEPAAVTMVPPGGTKVTYGLLLAAPGLSPQVVITANDYDMVQSVYQLELSPHEHICRHTQGGEKCAR